MALKKRHKLFPIYNTKTLLSAILISFTNSKMEEKYGEKERKKEGKRSNKNNTKKARVVMWKKFRWYFLVLPCSTARNHKDPLAGLFVAKYPWAQVAPAERKGLVRILVTGLLRQDYEGRGLFATSCEFCRLRDFYDSAYYPRQLSAPPTADAEWILVGAGVRSQPLTMGKETHRGEAMTDEAELSCMHD